MIQELKKNYQVKFKQLCKDFLSVHKGQTFLKKHTRLVDDLLLHLLKSLSIESHISLVAVGGYGREELYPYSDIDILILIPENLSQTDQEKITVFVTACWDLGLKIGHSVRTIKENRMEMYKDIKTTTNLLESRLLVGSKKEFLALKTSISSEINQRQFYIQKLQEQNARHKKFRDSAYQLEPNIKESPGGLRDLHMVLWVASSQNKGNTFKQLLANNVIDREEFNKVRFHLNRISKRRMLLHLLAGRAEDRLVFDLQNQLAEHLGYQSSGYKKASELVMKSYYKSVNYIILFNEIMLKKLDPLQHKNTAITHTLPFYEYDNLLEIDQSYQGNFLKHLFDPFIVFQNNKHLIGFGPNLLGMLDTNSKLINKSIREDKSTQDNFFTVLNGNNKVNRSLRLLNKCNILGKYIPSFGRVVAQMQHDLFHIYTVDEHTLNVVENIRRFSKAKLKHEFPECHRIFARFDKPYLLYLAAIFHDIAKGRGGDHSEKGEKVAKRFARSFGLSGEDSNLIAWLVKSHLKLSQVAQKEDLSDPSVIQRFTAFITTQYRLDALYLLTVADIRATSPHVWNQWKATLLKDLYNATSSYLSNQSMSAEELIVNRKNAAQLILDGYSISKKTIRATWQALGNDYFYKFDEHDIAWHSRVLVNYQTNFGTLIKVHHCRNGNGLEVLVYTKNVSNAFIKITNFFYVNQLDIAQARIHTTENGYALDIFNVLIEENASTSYQNLFIHIESELGKIIDDQTVLPKTMSLKKTRQASHHRINTQISYNNLANGLIEFHVITDEQKGLLSLIAAEINRYGFSISNAKINTLGGRAEDFFLLSSKEELEPATLKKLEGSIKNQLLN